MVASIHKTNVYFSAIKYNARYGRSQRIRGSSSGSRASNVQRLLCTTCLVGYLCFMRIFVKNSNFFSYFTIVVRVVYCLTYIMKNDYEHREHAPMYSVHTQLYLYQGTWDEMSHFFKQFIAIQMKIMKHFYHKCGLCVYSGWNLSQEWWWVIYAIFLGLGIC